MSVFHHALAQDMVSTRSRDAKIGSPTLTSSLNLSSPIPPPRDALNLQVEDAHFRPFWESGMGPLLD